MPKQISIYDPQGPVPAQRWVVAAGAVSTIYPGTPTKVAGTRGTNAVAAPMVDTDGTTSQVFLGIAKSISTDTVSVTGEVYVYTPYPGIIYSAQPKSTTAANTQAKIDNLLLGRYIFDLTGTVGPQLTGQWTIDIAAGDGSTNCIVIVGGDYQTNTLYFVYRGAGNYLA